MKRPLWRDGDLERIGRLERELERETMTERDRLYEELEREKGMLRES